MALFGRNKKVEDKKDKIIAVVPAAKTASSNITLDSSRIILNPHVTEKAAMHESAGAYTFNVSERANKRQIIQAVRELYKVTPRMVRVVTIPRKIKRSARTGKLGIKRGGKKAYVYLKKGDSISYK